MLASGFYFVGAAVYYHKELCDPEHADFGDCPSWLNGAGVPMPLKPGLNWDNVAPHYTAALYWTFTTITTVGYGDLTPTDLSERLYAIFAMIIGTGLFGYIV